MATAVISRVREFSRRDYEGFVTAGKFATKLFAVCMATGGNMDEVLGVTL
jgi:hypothetical protein